jgi:hypothetical protein
MDDTAIQPQPEKKLWPYFIGALLLAIVVAVCMSACNKLPTTGVNNSNQATNNNSPSYVQDSPVPASENNTVVEETPQFDDSKEAAANALADFKERIVDDETYRDFGFMSPEEVNAATLGDQPLAVYHIGLDQLSTYKASQDPNKLLGELGVIYPIMLQGRVRSSILLQKKDGKWPLSLARLESTRETEQLFNALNTKMEATKRPASAFFKVQVPGLNLDFLAQRQNLSAAPGAGPDFSLTLLETSHPQSNKTIETNAFFGTHVAPGGASGVKARTGLGSLQDAAQKAVEAQKKDPSGRRPL